MRLMGGFGIILTALATGLTLAAAVPAAYPAGAALAAPRTAAAHARTIRARHHIPYFGNPAGHAHVPLAARAVSTSRPNHVIGRGTPGSCTSRAVVRAVAKGGVITFNCGPKPTTITMTATAKVRNTSHRIVLDGGGLVTLSGGGKHQILYMDTCDPRQIWTTSHCQSQRWPQLIVQNLTFKDGNATAREKNGQGGGGGAIFDLGGQLKVVNSRFIDNRCYRTGPDLGGAAIRALEQYRGRTIYVSGSRFRGGRCSNGGALSSIGVSWDVINSLMTNNKAIGYGANPAAGGTAGGGSGGAIYTDGDNYKVTVSGTVIHYNSAREGGGGIFDVVDNNVGTLTIKNSTLHHNPSARFHTAGYPGIFFEVDGRSGIPVVINSTIN